MKRYQVEYSNQSEADIVSLYRHTAEAVGPNAANAFITRLKAFCSGFDLAPHRGTLQTDINPELRIVGFERSITVAFRVTDEKVEFLRFFARGANWADDFESDD